MTGVIRTGSKWFNGNIILVMLAAMLVLFGGLLLRISLVLAGQT